MTDKLRYIILFLYLMIAYQRRPQEFLLLVHHG